MFKGQVPRCTQDSCRDTPTEAEGKAKEQEKEEEEDRPLRGLVKPGQMKQQWCLFTQKEGRKVIAFPSHALSPNITRSPVPPSYLRGSDIVFFGEALPDRFAQCAMQDMKKCDLLLIMGTSLLVHPFASLVDK